jgi:murein DD-endopeptidase MepM/ murein hydrolase activator NlpD
MDTCLVIPLILIVFVLLAGVVSPATATQPKEIVPRPAAGVTIDTLAIEQTLPAHRGVVRHGQSFYVLLRQAGVSAAEILQLQKSVRPVYNLRHLRAGHQYTLTVTKDGRLHRFVYDINTSRRLQVKRQDDTFSAQIAPITYAHKHPPTVKPEPQRAPSSVATVPQSSPAFAEPHKILQIAMAAPRPAPAPPEGAMASHEGLVRHGQSFYVLLRQAGVSAAEILQLQKAIRPVYNLRHLRAGHQYTLTVTKDGRLHRFVYDIDTSRRLQVKRQDDTFSSRIAPITYAHKQRVVQGTINGSLHETLTALGETPQIAADLADIFAWDIDFYRDLRDGDAFRIMVDEHYRDGALVGYNRILAAEVINQNRLFQAVYYPPKDTGRDGDYYHPDGTSMRRMFLRAPLRYTRISSRFSRRRFHPILKRYRPHFGVDYAAPIGTPVHSVADGTVTWVGRKGANGKMVKIRHNDVYSTYYLHLSRYARSLHVGSHVSQGDIIGYVGATGLATGPHLCFRITKYGKYLNPLQHKDIQAPPLARQTLPIFRAYARQLLLPTTQHTIGGCKAWRLDMEI